MLLKKVALLHKKKKKLRSFWPCCYSWCFLFKSSCLQMFYKIGVHKKLAKVTENLFTGCSRFIIHVRIVSTMCLAKKKLCVAILIWFLTFLMKIPKLLRVFGVEFNLRTYKSVVCLDKNLMFMEKRKKGVRVHYLDFFAEVKMNGSSPNSFLLLNMIFFWISLSFHSLFLHSFHCFSCKRQRNANLEINLKQNQVSFIWTKEARNKLTKKNCRNSWTRLVEDTVFSIEYD